VTTEGKKIYQML